MLYKRVLTIAGSDSGGGAGIQADLKTFAACGCFGMSAITAITAQNTLGVTAVHPIPCDIIEKQIEAVIDDIGVDSIKIGMLNSSDIILTVKNILLKYKIRNIVLDPVMVSTSGHKLMQDSAIDTLRELIPFARIITPNIPEAEILLGRKIETANELSDCAKELSMNREISVLMKAGHLNTRYLTDIFYNAETDEIVELQAEKIETRNTHGTGCTLSSAVAAYLAHNQTLTEAVRNGREYIYQAILHGAQYSIGKGFGSTHHFYKYWE